MKLKMYLLIIIFMFFIFPIACSTFGHKILSEFSIEKGYINFNHGSFGTIPNDVRYHMLLSQSRIDACPDRFFRYELYDSINKIRELLGSYINCPFEDLVLLDNASTGMNTVLRSIMIAWKNGLISKNRTKLLYLNEAYPMVKHVFEYITNQYPIELIIVNITYPTSSNDILQLVNKEFNKYPNDFILASFSHISSMPSLILPVKELIRTSHSFGTMVVIDGAHALGQIPLNLLNLNSDFYVANAHKWLYSPKPSAILYVKKQLQSFIYPSVINDQGQGDSDFQKKFSWMGTIDYSSKLSIAAAFRFRKKIGGEDAILDYLHDIAINGSSVVTHILKTELLVNSSMFMAIFNVRLPIPKYKKIDVDDFSKKFFQKYKYYIPVFALQSHYYVRICVQIWHELSDFQFLGEALIKFIPQYLIENDL